MNLFQLVFKQMRQRALSTWLTLLSVVLGVALAVSIMVLQRASGELFGQSDFGYELIIGPPTGSPLQLVLNTVYHLDRSPGTLPYQLYEEMAAKGGLYEKWVRIAVPFMVGDSYHGRSIVGTSPQMFGFDDNGNPIANANDRFAYRKDQSYELAEGHVFAPKKFEAVLGSEVAKDEHFVLYDPSLSEEENEKRHAVFQATHGFPGPHETPDIHKPKWHVVGILKPTHTANDRVLFIPIVSLYAIEEHGVGLIKQTMMKQKYDPTAHTPAENTQWLDKHHWDPVHLPPSLKKEFGLSARTAAPTSGAAGSGELMKDAAPGAAVDQSGDDDDAPAYELDKAGDIVPFTPKDEWEISAILIKARGPLQTGQLSYYFKVIDPQAAAVSPASVMQQFFDTFLRSSALILLVVSFLVTIVAGVGILVSIYNSVSARSREIAILRALGATRWRVLTLICTEAGLVGLLGSIIGWIIGHAAGGIESYYFNVILGQTFSWWSVDLWEIGYLVLVVVLAVLAGLVPALKAYRTPVATNLTAG